MFHQWSYWCLTASVQPMSCKIRRKIRIHCLIPGFFLDPAQELAFSQIVDARQIFAFANGEIEIAMTLLENGANSKQKLSTGETIEKMLRNQGMGDFAGKLLGRTTI